MKSCQHRSFSFVMVANICLLLLCTGGKGSGPVAEAVVRPLEQDVTSLWLPIVIGQMMPYVDLPPDTQLMIRQGPGTIWPIIGTIRGGEVLNLVCHNDSRDWYMLDTGGWVYGEYIANVPPLDLCHTLWLPVVTNPNG